MDLFPKTTISHDRWSILIRSNINALELKTIISTQSKTQETLFASQGLILSDISIPIEFLLRLTIITQDNF